MASVQAEVQKELTQEEFDYVLAAFEESINDNIDLDLLSRTLKTFVKEITPAKEIHLLGFSEKNDSVVSDIENNIHIDLSSSQGMISTCYKKKEPQFTNDVDRYNGYDVKVDNAYDYNLKNLLILPLQDVNENLFAVLWAGIPKGDINQYISRDIEHLTQLLHKIEYVIPQEEDKAKEIDQSKEMYQSALKEIDHIKSKKYNKVESPILVQKIQSWLTGFKKNKK